VKLRLNISELKLIKIRINKDEQVCFATDGGDNTSFWPEVGRVNVSGIC